MIKWLRNLFKRGVSGAAEASSTTATDTEFTAAVVRVASIVAHPNADKLEIARFELKDIGETTYEVVVGKGEFTPGDLAAYFSVDCILPTAHPDFAFLTKRPDGAGKSHFRLRAARIRKHFSQGLLVPNSLNLPFGTQIAEQYGVTYHRAPEPNSPSEQHPKKVRPQPAPVYTVDSLKKLPRLFAEGEPVFITEKIHGTNFRFGWVRRRLFGIPLGWRFFVGSHRVAKGSAGRGGSHYYGEDIWLQAADKMDLARKTKAHKGMVFYGELYGYTYSGSPIQDLTYGRKPEDGPGLAVFDVKDLDVGCWLNPWERIELLDSVGLEWAPVLAPYQHWREGLAQWYAEPIVPSAGPRLSNVDDATLMEGVVVESMGGPHRKAKYVCQAYLERKE